MMIVTPRIIDDDQYVGGNLAEDDYTVWTSGTDYVRGNYVLTIATHSIYQALRDHTADADNSPTAEALVFADPLQEDPDPASWVRTGASNKWRLFDTRPSQRAEKADSIRVDLLPDKKADTVGFVNVEDCGRIVVGVIGNVTKARLAWTEAVDGGSVIIDYEYRYRIGSGAWSSWTLIPNSDTETTYYDATGLDYDETDYEFQLRAVNATGNGTAESADLASTTYDSLEDSPAASTGSRLSGGQTRPGAGSVPEAPNSFTAVQSRVELGCQFLAMNDPVGIVDWFSYFFTDNRLYDQRLARIPITFGGDVVLITLSGGTNLGCGQIVLGLSETVGEAVADNSGFETLDFSHAETDIYGNLTTVERASVESYKFTVHTPVAEVSTIISAIRAQKGGKLALWIGDDDPGVRGWNYGFLSDYRAYYESGTYLRSDLTVQGAT